MTTADTLEQRHEAMAEAAELIADEMIFLYGEIGYEHATIIKDWCHLWAANFRAGRETVPNVGDLR